MNTETAHILVPAHGATVDRLELARICRLAPADIDELVEYGLLHPVPGSAGEPAFSPACVQPLRAANDMRLRYDLDVFVLGLLFTQFEHVARLEQQLHFLQAHLPHGRAPRDGPATWREPHG